MKAFHSLLVAAGMIALSAPAAPFSNGSFEQPGITSGTEQTLALPSTAITGWTAANGASVYSAADDFSATVNTATSTWQYGYRSTLASSSLTRYDNASTWYGTNSWTPTGSTTPGIFYNGTSGALTGDDWIMQPNQLTEHPGGGVIFCVIRWTAPAGGPPGGRTYAIHADWVGLGSSSTADVHVLINGSSVYDGTVSGRGTTANTDGTLTLPFTLPAGMTVEFVVGDGGNGHGSDTIAVNATITEVVSGSEGMTYLKNGNSMGVVAQDGTHMVGFGLNGGHAGALSQTFDTVPGATYDVTYWLAQSQFNGNDGQTMSVEAFNGRTSLGAVASSSLPVLQNQWIQGTTYTFTATSTSTKLVFKDTTPQASGANANWALDNVSLTITALPALLASPFIYGGHTYYLVNQTTWQGGEAEAVARGGHLVTINDAAEQTNVFNAFKNVGNVARHLWIGLYETGSEGNYVWISGQAPSPQPPNYPRWYPGQPDNYGGVESYVHMVANGYGGDSTGLWNDQSSPVTTIPLADPFAAIVEVESAQPVVPGYANVWLAGHPAGTPARVTDSAPADSPTEVTVTGGKDLVFTVTGGTSNGPSGPAMVPDGANIITHEAENSIAPLTAPLTALVGVFVDASAPSGDAPPAYLDYTTDVARNALHYAPGLRQPFYIGDGLTPDNVRQVFRVPTGATRLFLGALDAYDNHLNFGSFTVEVAEAPPPQDTIEPPQNLVSWWPGENTAWDVAGIGRGSMKNAAHNGMDAYGPGKVGLAFVFDGVDDHIQGRPTGISLVQELTIEAWINPSSTTGEREIISKRDDNNANISYALFLRDGHLVYLSRMAGVNSELADTGSIAANQWTHVAMTESYTAGRKLYVNGTMVASAAGLPPVRPVTTGVLSIGAYVTTASPTATPGAPFAGSIDELSLFNRALSATEIGFIVNVGAGGKDRADPARDYSPVANPNTPWKYGWIQSGPISASYLEGGNPAQGGLFPKPAQMAGSFLAYMGPSQVIFNQSSTQRLISGPLEVNPLQFALNPAPDGSYAVLRWTAPSSGRFAVSATFAGAHAYLPTTSDVHVLRNSDRLFDSVVNDFQGDGTSFTGTVVMAAGDTVDWVVGGNGAVSGDHTGLVASVTLIDHSPFQTPTLVDFKFTGTLMTGKTVLVNAVSGARPDYQPPGYQPMTARLQYSATPWDESSWQNVPGGEMTPTGKYGFTLLVNTLPAGRYAFRIDTSVAGVGGAHSAPSDMYDVLPPGSALEMKVTAVSTSDLTGATTHRGDYIDYLVQFRNTGGVAVLPSVLPKIEARIPAGTTYVSSSPAATPTPKTGTTTLITWPIARTIYPVDQAFTFTASASTDFITIANHGFDDGDTVELRSTSTPGALPGGLYQGVVYKVMSSTMTGFKLAELDKTTAVNILDAGIGTFTLSRQTDTWQKRKFRVSVKDPTIAEDKPTPAINIPGTNIVSDVKFIRQSAADLVAAPVTTTVVNPLRLTGTIRSDSELMQGGIVNIDFTVTNGASYTATGTTLVVRAPDGLAILNRSAFVASNGDTMGAPIDPVTKKQIPGYATGKPNPSLEEDALLNQVVTFNLGNMLAGTALTCRVSFRIQYDWNPLTPISFNNAIASMTRAGRNSITRTLPSPLVINAAAIPDDRRPSLSLNIDHQAAGFLPDTDHVAIVMDRSDTLTGTELKDATGKALLPIRTVRQIQYFVTYRNHGGSTAEFIRLLVPIPANTTYVANSAIVMLAAGDKNPAGTTAPTLVGSALIFNLPYLEKAGVLGSEKTLTFRVNVKTGLPVGTRIVQPGGSLTSRTLRLAKQAPMQLEAEMSSNAKMVYLPEGHVLWDGDQVAEVWHRLSYQNLGSLPASGVEIRYAIPPGYLFKGASFLTADAKTDGVKTALILNKPNVNATSGTVVFSVGTVNKNAAVNGKWLSKGGYAAVRLAPDPANPPTSANNWRRDGSFTYSSVVPAPPPIPRLPPPPLDPIITSLAPSKLFIGVMGAPFYDPAKDQAGTREITYQLIWGSNFSQTPGAGGIKFPIPEGTTYVRHTPYIPLIGTDRSESGTYRPPGDADGGTNGIVGYGLHTGTNYATTAFVTVRINPGFTGRIDCVNVRVGGDRAGLLYAPIGRTTVFQPGDDQATKDKRLAADRFGSIQLADAAAGSAGKTGVIKQIQSIQFNSSWANFAGTDAIVIAANNAVLIPLGAGRIVAAGGGNIVGEHGAGIVGEHGAGIVGEHGAGIVAGGGGNIVAAGGGNIVAAGGGNIFSGVTNIVAAGGGNIVAAGGGNFVHVDVPGRGMISANDVYANIASIVAGGGGNIVAGGGGNLIDKQKSTVNPDGSGFLLNGAHLIGQDGASFGSLSIDAKGLMSLIPPTVVQSVQALTSKSPALIAKNGAAAAAAVAALKGGFVGEAGKPTPVNVNQILNQDAASILNQDAATILNQDAASLIGQDGASLIGQDGASLIGQDGASLINQAASISGGVTFGKGG
ncbi:MAG: DUF642 domain-containing protein [Verrucomicrobiaceae bacterium]|nr:DUF642 domain-containing protein [Verrucomicrobiaceae bacterium]